MGWMKSDYEGKVCWEQNGQRVFNTDDIEMLENKQRSEPINFRHTNNDAVTGWVLLVVFIFLIGVSIGIFI